MNYLDYLPNRVIKITETCWTPASAHSGLNYFVLKTTTYESDYLER